MCKRDWVKKFSLFLERPIKTPMELWGFDSGTSAVIVLALVVGGIAIMTLIICLVIRCCKTKRRDSHSGESHPVPSRLTDSLIPPIFFTADMKDPLHQEDLCDTLKPRPGTL
jgi:hypothetical protein